LSCCSFRQRCPGTTPGRWPWCRRLAQSRPAIALIAGFSTWIMVIFKPDGSHGMYSWIHVLLATACAVAAWYSLYRVREPTEPDQYAIA